MRNSDNDDASDVNGAASPGYAANQLAKALLASEQTADPELAQRATRRVAQWQAILSNLGSGAAQYRSRTPLPDTPAWATLEVATGGFATGRLLAGGPLEPHEARLISRLAIPEDDDTRRRLNDYFLTTQGMAELLSWLDDSCYSIRYPEEGALLAIAWLCSEGHVELARDILSTISPFFATLRFYPVPDICAPRFEPGVQVQDVAATREKLRRIAPNTAILAQRQAVDLWAPLHDRLLALFAETMNSDDWPCQVCPADWAARAGALLSEISDVDQRSKLPSKYRKAGSHYAQLRAYLQACVTSFGSLPPRDLGRIRHIFRCSVAKRGHPLAAQNVQARQRQRADVAAPLYADVAQLVEQRLAPFDQHEGLDDPDLCMGPITQAEATSSVPLGTAIPQPLRRRIGRCLRDSIDVLLSSGLITSSEMLASVLPQLTSGMHGLGFEDLGLRQLYAGIYLAFRRRRSLLLLNLESQVRLSELPWVSAIERFRREDATQAAASRQALEYIVSLTLQWYPYTILPNKLVREIAELAARSGLEIPMVEELATDIFMGEFSPKFTAAAKLACGMLQDSLYADYYQIDVAQVLGLPEPHVSGKMQDGQAAFAQLCAHRAGVRLGQWRPASNGMIIEQQQILTTQNLAALIFRLDLRGTLQSRFGLMAQSCFGWICSRHKVKVDGWHAQLIRIKNSAYAWRQMVFSLSMLTPSELQWAFERMEERFGKQPEQFQLRFRPVFDGLKECASARTASTPLPAEKRARQFLGWSETRHWLLPDAEVEGV